jgi:hypothetical protein
MNRLVTPKITAQATHETAAVPAGAAADLRMPVIYELWLATWETALTAVATATRIRALSTDEAAAYGAVLKAERELVTKHFALLLGSEPPGGQ